MNQWQYMERVALQNVNLQGKQWGSSKKVWRKHLSQSLSLCGYECKEIPKSILATEVNINSRFRNLTFYSFYHTKIAFRDEIESNVLGDKLTFSKPAGVIPACSVQHMSSEPNRAITIPLHMHTGMAEKGWDDSRTSIESMKPWPQNPSKLRQHNKSTLLLP